MNPPPPSPPPDVPPMRGQKTFWLLMLLSIAFVLLVAYLQYSRFARARAQRATPASEHVEMVRYPAPDFRLTAHTRKPLSLADLRGHVWVADFIFTRCQGPCPAMTAQMAELQEEFKVRGFHDVRCVSFTVDPEYDTVERLAKYAAAFGADPARWLFVTGEKKTMRDLIVFGFKMAVQDPPPDEDQVLHSTQFLVVDKTGQVRGNFDGLYTDPDDPTREQVGAERRGLVETVARLRLEVGP